MRPVQPARDEHARPDGDDGEIKNGAAQRLYPKLMSAPRGRITVRGDVAAADELTSRTVKVAVRFDEH